jgi:hypothetical protein
VIPAGWLVVGKGSPSRPGRDPSTGGAGGSRAEEVQKPGRRVQAPSARVGLLRRALDAPAEPVTLPPGREGARPPQVTAA